VDSEERPNPRPSQDAVEGAKTRVFYNGTSTKAGGAEASGAAEEADRKDREVFGARWNGPSVSERQSLHEELETTGIPRDQYLALAPGVDLQLTTNLNIHESHRQASFVGCGEVIVRDHVHGHHTSHFRLPTDRSGHTGDLLTITRVVVVTIRQKAIGWKSLGTNLILFFNRANTIVTRLDSSVEYGRNSAGTWEFRHDALEELCCAGGIEFQTESFDNAPEFLSKRPDWIPPVVEFEVDHLREERVREWGLAIALAIPIACGLLVAVGGLLIWLGPVGWTIEVAEVIGMMVAAVLTVWSHSNWRMKRSLRKRHLRIPT
jgi:hypothetical protein